MKKLTQDKIKELKAQHGDVFLYETDDKKYGAVFRAPTRSEFGIFQAMSKQNSLTAMTSLANTTFIEGDKEVINDTAYFYGLSVELLDTIEVKSGSLGKL